MRNKKTHLADFVTCVFRVYLRNHLSYEKVIYIYIQFIVVWRAFRWKIRWYLQKRWFKKKVSYWKRSAILKNSKTIFHGSIVQELNLHTNIHTKQARCVCRMFVYQISISCQNNNEQIRYLFLSICSLSIGHLFD